MLPYLEQLGSQGCFLGIFLKHLYDGKDCNTDTHTHTKRDWMK